MAHLHIKPLTDELKFLPVLGTPLSAGLDIPIQEDVTVPAGALGYKIPLGIACKLLTSSSLLGHYWLIPRSSTGCRTPLRQSNAVGLIDADYRGQLMWPVDNLSDEPYTIKAGTRLVQLVPKFDATIKAIDVDPDAFDEEETKRGTGGFGSTGSTSRPLLRESPDSSSSEELELDAFGSTSENHYLHSEGPGLSEHLQRKLGPNTGYGSVC